MTLFSFTGVVVQEDQGFSSLCPELDIASCGDTPEEAREKLLEAATLHLEGAIEDGIPYLRPVTAEADPRNTAADKIVLVFSFKVDVSVHAYA